MVTKKHRNYVYSLPRLHVKYSNTNWIFCCYWSYIGPLWVWTGC